MTFALNKQDAVVSVPVRDKPLFSYPTDFKAGSTMVVYAILCCGFLAGHKYTLIPEM